jgi:hypothetical protein
MYAHGSVTDRGDVEEAIVAAVAERLQMSHDEVAKALAKGR